MRFIAETLAFTLALAAGHGHAQTEPDTSLDLWAYGEEGLSEADGQAAVERLEARAERCVPADSFAQWRFTVTFAGRRVRDVAVERVPGFDATPTYRRSARCLARVLRRARRPRAAGEARMHVTATRQLTGPGGPGSSGVEEPVETPGGLSGLGEMGHGEGSGERGAPRRRSDSGVVFGSPQVRGEGLPPAVIQRVVRANAAALGYCYQTARRRAPDLEGSLVVRFTIGARGRVREAAVGRAAASIEPIAECVLRQIRRWRFPPPDDGETVVVRFPFVFAGDDDEGDAPSER